MTVQLRCLRPACERPVSAHDLCHKHYVSAWKAGIHTESRSKQDRIKEAIRELDAPGWEPIPGRLGYFARTDGQIATLVTGRSVRRSLHVLSQQDNRTGYPTVRIAGKRIPVHRLVGETFLGPLPTGLQTRHLDGNRGNSAASNLAYGTAVENAADRVRHGTQTHGERHPGARLTDAEVSQAVHLYLSSGLTQREVGAMYGTTQPVISRWVLAHRAGTQLRTPRPGHMAITSIRPKETR